MIDVAFVVTRVSEKGMRRKFEIVRYEPKLNDQAEKKWTTIPVSSDTSAGFANRRKWHKWYKNMDDKVRCQHREWNETLRLIVKNEAVIVGDISYVYGRVRTLPTFGHFRSLFHHVWKGNSNLVFSWSGRDLEITV